MIRLHHVQIAIPPGGEDEARRFFVDGVGMTEVAKPEALRSRGGAWFRAYDGSGAVTAELHAGVEEPFAPARKAHPALLVGDLSAVGRRLERLGFRMDLAEAETFPGHRRAHVFDGHGNRVELLEAV